MFTCKVSIYCPSVLHDKVDVSHLCLSIMSLPKQQRNKWKNVELEVPSAMPGSLYGSLSND